MVSRNWENQSWTAIPNWQHHCGDSWHLSATSLLQFQDPPQQFPLKLIIGLLPSCFYRLQCSVFIWSYCAQYVARHSHYTLAYSMVLWYGLNFHSQKKKKTSSDIIHCIQLMYYYRVTPCKDTHHFVSCEVDITWKDNKVTNNPNTAHGKIHNKQAHDTSDLSTELSSPMVRTVPPYGPKSPTLWSKVSRLSLRYM